METYAYTDTCQDVLGSLEHCELSLIQARNSDRAWKWVVLSLHSALQGAMVFHLTGSANLGALTESCAKKQENWDEKDRCGKISWIPMGVDEFGVPHERLAKQEQSPPKELIASASILFKRLSCCQLRIEPDCGGIVSITERQKKSFRLLHSLRNKFTHFSPKGWSIEIQLIVEVIDDMTGVLCLILDDPWTSMLMHEEERLTLRSKLQDIRSAVSQCRRSRLANDSG